jgi:MarR family transcriptional regulator, organic hydroperoxide resistance regulator
VPDQELGALLADATRRLIDAERPILETHGLSMWGYAALSQLAREAAPTQVALARAMRYDKNRLIGLLDQLQAQDLIVREPDPADRRNLIVRLTSAGRQRHAAARVDIDVMEDRLLDGLTREDRETLRRSLVRIAQAETGQPGLEG